MLRKCCNEYKLKKIFHQCFLFAKEISSKKHSKRKPKRFIIPSQPLSPDCGTKLERNIWNKQKTTYKFYFQQTSQL